MDDTQQFDNQLELIPKEQKEKKEAKRVPHLTLASVESSNIRSIGYCLETQILGVKFNDGSVYLYAGVSDIAWAGLQAAPSKGSFLSKEIRNRYACTKLVQEA